MQAALNVHILEPVEASPAPRTLLFAHGYGCDQRMWDEVAATLTGHRRILFDWPGAGAADMRLYDATRHADLDGYAQDLLLLMASLELRSAVVVGHSVAASIAALAARQDPSRFGCLAMVAPSPCFLNDPPEYRGGFERAELEGLLQGLADGHAAWAGAMAPVIMGNAERPALAARLADSFCDMDPAIAVRWARATFLADVRAVMPQLTIPCLVMACQEDALAPPEVGRWLHRHLRHGRLVQLQARGHCPHVSAAAEVAAVLSAWLHEPAGRA